ncbi:isopentenyl-diphosphate delta-isomerase [Desulfurococcus amylolyticus 1221n]|uniref:Isopentenyl-diphosphate delta-isomerase n=1 Tax=Desulfurococcus amylolyticus (strain DSM 18924 / JCM 16383 / VKM B-2413 / 1221n) TaxID=490899 RepID=B8D6F1_DESA1|nr:type 2 isopentenyl-diphosphate Delta-isomerase [Desulfurococcus amylolyticus]ACL11682.1 isopentenyl-diphosphate delta-isomerase [Desulfurococcus amylolyticus 1221n]
MSAKLICRLIYLRKVVLSMDEIQNRKLHHIRLALDPRVDFKDHCSEIYREIQLVHQALPGLDFDEVDVKQVFLGYRLEAPIMITGMTGGHPSLVSINKMLATLAEKKRVAIGVGSQRAIVKSNFSEDVVASYRIVRETARSVPVIGNIGLNTLRDIDTDTVIRLVEVIDADAIAIHLNPAQEVIQPEGDTRFSLDVIDKVKELVASLRKPVIIKEVGNGLSMETVRIFHNIGVKIYDTAGACGTNWALVETLRNQPGSSRYECGLKLSEWGIPTPLSVIETRYVAEDSFIIASGGVWDGFKAAVNIAIGADMVGVAKPILKNILDNGLERAEAYLDNYIFELKTAMFLSGARNIGELRSKPIILGQKIVNTMLQRGINPHTYLNNTRRMK